MGKVSKYMCLGCWSSAGPAQVVRADGQVLTLRKATTVGELLRRLKSGDCFYVCEASTPGMNSPLFPPPPPPRMADNPLFAPASPVQGGPRLPLDAKLQRGHLYFILPLPLPEQERDQEIGAGNSQSYAPNSLSNLLRRSSGEDLSGLQRSRRGSGSSNYGGNQGGALKSAIARRISTKISPELGTAFDSGFKPGPAHHLVYELLTKQAVQSGNLKPVMRSWQDRAANAGPAKFTRRRRRSLRTYSGSWKPDLPIISEDGTLASCLCPAMLSDTDDDSITMLPASPSATVPACSSPSAKIFRLSKSPPQRSQ